MVYQQTKLPPAKDDYAFRVRQLLDELSRIDNGENKLRRVIGAEGFFKFLDDEYYKLRTLILDQKTLAWAKANALYSLQSEKAREAGIFGEEDLHAILDREEDESEALDI